MVTETDAIARALDDAARRWPDEGGRARLLLRLVEEGHRSIMEERLRAHIERHRAVEETSGALTGCYETGYLDRLRADWPE